MDTITVYGIPNCDMIKKTMAWFAVKKIPVSFHDYKQEGISKAKLNAWCKLVSWDVLLNKRSTTWRELPITAQEKITGQALAIELMTTHTSIIKRPVIEYKDKLLVGFDEKAFIQQLK